MDNDREPRKRDRLVALFKRNRQISPQPTTPAQEKPDTKSPLPATPEPQTLSITKSPTVASSTTTESLSPVPTATPRPLSPVPTAPPPPYSASPTSPPAEIHKLPSTPEIPPPREFNEETPNPTKFDSDDKQRTTDRYIEASNLLYEAIKGRESQWGTFEFPELSGELESFNVSQFKDNINNIIESRRANVKRSSSWGKCEHAIQCFFTAFSPFAKSFLRIAAEGQSVSPFMTIS